MRWGGWCFRPSRATPTLLEARARSLVAIITIVAIAVAANLIAAVLYHGARACANARIHLWCLLCSDDARHLRVPERTPEAPVHASPPHPQ